MNLTELLFAVHRAEAFAAEADISTDYVGVCVYANVDPSRPAVRLNLQAVEINEYVDPGEKNVEVALVSGSPHRRVVNFTPL